MHVFPQGKGLSYRPLVPLAYADPTRSLGFLLVSLEIEDLLGVQWS